MSREVWRYSLAGGITDIEMPVGAQVLSVGYDLEHYPVIWALVVPTRAKETRRFTFAGTGMDIDAVQFGSLLTYRREYVGTVQVPRVNAVWHVFELTTATPEAW